MATEPLDEETSKSKNSNETSTQQQSSRGGKSNSNEEELINVFGKCKWFNVAKGYGFITPETNDSTDPPRDVFVYQSNIQMAGFRSLREGERVRFTYKPSHLGYEAMKVCGPSGEDCIGSEKRPTRRKRPDRCYNCGDSGHHAKECEHPPLPKRCHNCKAVEHLVADCPVKRESHSSEHTESESSPPPSSEQSTSPSVSTSPTISKLT